MIRSVDEEVQCCVTGHSITMAESGNDVKAPKKPLLPQVCGRMCSIRSLR